MFTALGIDPRKRKIMTDKFIADLAAANQAPLIGQAALARLNQASLNIVNALLAGVAIAMTVAAATMQQPVLLVAVGPAFASAVCMPQMRRAGLDRNELVGDAAAAVTSLALAQLIGAGVAITLWKVMTGSSPLLLLQIALVPAIIRIMAMASDPLSHSVFDNAEHAVQAVNR